MCIRDRCGVRQGGVLSPCLFAIFIDSVVDRVIESGLGCYLNMTCFSRRILLYADDIVLLAPSVHSLQLLLRTCEDELSCLDMMQYLDVKNLFVTVQPV